MDNFLFVLCGFIAVTIAIPWVSIALFPVFLAITSSFVAQKIAAHKLAYLAFKSRLHGQMLLHIKATAQPKKFCACLYVHQNQYHLGVQFASQQECWSHHVKASSLNDIEVRLREKLRHPTHQSHQQSHYPCASQSVCPNLPHRRPRRRARELFMVRFKPQIVGLAALELGAIAALWAALSAAC